MTAASGSAGEANVTVNTTNGNADTTAKTKKTSAAHPATVLQPFEKG